MRPKRTKKIKTKKLHRIEFEKKRKEMGKFC